MKAYRLNMGKYVEMLKNGDPVEIIFPAEIESGRYYAADSLRQMKFSEDEITGMVDRGILCKVDIDPETWAEFEAIERSRENLRKGAEQARSVRDAAVHKRRQYLSDEVIALNFGGKPNILDVRKLCELLETRYADFVEASYPVTSGKEFYKAVRRDAVALGFIPMDYEDARREKISVSRKEKYETDPEFRKKVDASIQAANKARHNVHDPRCKKLNIKALGKARLAPFKDVRKRRYALLNDIILPNYGKKGPAGYEKPESLSVAWLCHVLQKDYNDFTEKYRSGVGRRFHAAVRGDLEALGIRPLSLGESRDIRSRLTKERIANDRAELERRQKSAENARNSDKKGSALKRKEKAEQRRQALSAMICSEFGGLKPRMERSRIMALLDEKYPTIRGLYGKDPGRVAYSTLGLDLGILRKGVQAAG